MSSKSKSSFRGRVVTNGKKATKSNSGKFSYLNLPDGVSQLNFDNKVKKVQMDILPYVITSKNHPDKEDGAVQGSLWYKRPFKVHRNIGADNKSVVCLSSFGKKCPICEYQKELFKTDKEAAIKLYSKPRYLYAVIPLDSEKHEQKIYIWDMAESLFQEVLIEKLEEDIDNEIFPDLEEGKTLEVSFKWKQLGENHFPETRNIEFLDREEPYKESMLKKVPDLDKILKELSYDEISNLFFENSDEDIADEDDEIEEKPVRKKVTKPVVEEEDDDDEEEEDEKPMKRTSKTIVKKDEKPVAKKKPTPVADDEEEDEDEEQYTWEDLLELRQSKLEKIVMDLAMDIDVDDYDDDENALRKAIAKELGIEIPKTKVVKETQKPTSKESGKGKCPHGHKFGKDFDMTDDCDACKLWDKCGEENE
jgi:hypothetical protein